MIGLIILSILLIVIVIILVCYILFVKGLTQEKFIQICNKKIERISDKKSLSFLNNLHLSNFAEEKIKIHSVIYGKKFIYLLHNYSLIGSVEGNKNDNSWIFYNRKTKCQEYIENLIDVGNKNIEEIAGILGINAEFLVSIAVVPNECDFKIKEVQNKQNFVENYSKLSSIINEFESKGIGSFKPEQIDEKFTLLKKKNEERKS